MDRALMFFSRVMVFLLGVGFVPISIPFWPEGRSGVGINIKVMSPPPTQQPPTQPLPTTSGQVDITIEQLNLILELYNGPTMTDEQMEELLELYEDDTCTDEELELLP